VAGQWVGIGKIANWFFYSAPACVVVFLIGVALRWLLAALVS